MTSGFILVKPIGLPHAPSSQRGFVRAPRSACRNLFGSPVKGESDDLRAKEEAGKIREFSQKFKVEAVQLIQSNEKPSKKSDENLMNFIRSNNSRTISKETPTHAKCSSGRAKPYARQQASITEFYNQRKVVACNNSRIADAHSPDAELLLPNRIHEESIGTENSPATNTPASTNESPSSLSSPTHHHCNPMQQTSLHTTDHQRTELDDATNTN